jgi:hypothetical protein
MSARPTLECGAFLGAQGDLDGGASSTGHSVRVWILSTQSAVDVQPVSLNSSE